MRGSGDVLEPFDPWRPYRKPKPDGFSRLNNPALEAMAREGQARFAQITERLWLASGVPTALQRRVWRRFDRCCH